VIPADGGDRPVRTRFVAFEPRGDGYIVFFPLEEAMSEADPKDLGALSEAALELYRSHVCEVRRLLALNAVDKESRRPIPAERVWRVGEAVMGLKSRLADLSLEVDNLYAHLCRDADASLAWLGRAVTFRRYLPDADKIPPGLTWRKCEKAPRGAALAIRRAKTGAGELDD